MPDAWRLLVALLASYLLGSFPTGWLLVKWLRRVDVRTVGSGNVGATNVTRAAGLTAGVAVFLLDLAKGLVAVGLVAPWVAPSATLGVRLGCGVAAIVGHDFPIVLGFHGGKGVATTFGVLFVAEPFVGVVALVVWVTGFLLWRYVSAGSLAAAVSIPVTQWLRGDPGLIVGLGGATALLIIVRHRTNIARLVAGTEHRLGRPQG